MGLSSCRRSVIANFQHCFSFSISLSEGEERKEKGREGEKKRKKCMIGWLNLNACFLLMLQVFAAFKNLLKRYRNCRKQSYRTHMQILGQIILLVIVCSVLELHKRVLLVFLEAFIMDCASCLKFLNTGNEFFGCGFLVFGRFSHVFNVLGLFFMLCLGLKFLQFGFINKGILQFVCDIRGKSKSNYLRDGFCLKHGLNEDYDPKIRTCQSGPLELLDNCKEDIDGKAECIIEDDSDEKEKAKDCCPEDTEFDVMALRKLVKIERRKAKAACQELEKERIASKSSAEEAMAMILRLQSEKSSIEINFNQYKRMSEQKQEYDQQVIESLQWIIMKYESDRSLLEEQLQLCRQKLKLYMKEDELERFELDAGFSFLCDTPEDVMEHELVSSPETETVIL